MVPLDGEQREPVRVLASRQSKGSYPLGTNSGEGIYDDQIPRLHGDLARRRSRRANRTGLATSDGDIFPPANLAILQSRLES